MRKRVWLLLLAAICIGTGGYVGKIALHRQREAVKVKAPLDKFTALEGMLQGGISYLKYQDCLSELHGKYAIAEKDVLSGRSYLEYFAEEGIRRRRYQGLPLINWFLGEPSYVRALGSLHRALLKFDEAASIWKFKNEAPEPSWIFPVEGFGTIVFSRQDENFWILAERYPDLVWVIGDPKLGNGKFWEEIGPDRKKSLEMVRKVGIAGQIILPENEAALKELGVTFLDGKIYGKGLGPADGLDVGHLFISAEEALQRAWKEASDDVASAWRELK